MISSQSLTYVLCALLIFSCSKSKSNKVESATGDQAVLSVERRELTTTSGKTFALIIEPSDGRSLVKVKVQTSNFTLVNDTYDLGELDPLEDTFLADLDSNGFEELYITTRSVGSGSYSSILGMASNFDKSVSTIYLPQISELSETESTLFVGYRGHNKFGVENGVLVNRFPVYRDGDTNAEPTGGNNKIIYALKAGESSWILSPRIE